MRNRKWKIALITTLIGVGIIILLQLYLVFFYGEQSKRDEAIEFLKKLKIWEKKDSDVKIVNGNYLSQMVRFDTKTIKGKNYKIITGWFNYYDLQMADNYLSVAYGRIDGKEFNYDSTLAVQVDNVTVLEKGKNRPFDIDDLMEIKNDGMWTFKYTYEIGGDEENPKLVLQKPKKVESSLRVKSFYSVIDERTGQILKIGKDYEWWMDLESNDELLFLEMDETYENDVKKIKDDEYVLSGDYNDYVPAILKRTQAIWESEYDHRDENINYYIRVVNGAKDYDFGETKTFDGRLINNYIFNGDYLCSNFNDFCFLYINDVIYDSKFVLDQNGSTIYIDNFDFNCSLCFEETEDLSSNLIFSIEKSEGPIVSKENYFISRRTPIKVYSSLTIRKINVNDFVDSDVELKQRVEKLRAKGTEIIFKYNYNLFANGKLVCEDINEIERLAWLECILQANALSITKINNN